MIADHIVEWEIHLDERFLHTPDMGCCSLNELFPVAEIRAQRGDLRIGSEATAEQTDAVQLLDLVRLLYD